MSWLLLIIAAGSQVSPSASDILDDVVANREQVRTLHLKSTSLRKSDGLQVHGMELYLDVDNKRWRRDTVGLAQLENELEAADRLTYDLIMSSCDGLVYRFSPTTPTVVATIESLAKPANPHRIYPFPDPRNAGLVHIYQGNTGTPFEIGGDRLPVFKVQLDPKDAEDVSVEPTKWDNKSAWKIAWTSWVDPLSGDKYLREYVAVPEWGNSVVSVKTDCYHADQAEPFSRYSVTSEIALHDETKIWFPAKFVYLASIDGKTTANETTEFEIISLNRPISKSVFTFAGMGLLPGQTVVDMSKPTATKNKWDGEKVALMTPEQLESQVTLETNESSQRNIILLSIVIFFLAVAVWFKGRKARAAAA